eukprot:m.131641 g.131641  ORF g.131641 m.131641 type:complete len:544 (+) comp16824_c1_seq4:132-1763(+)
MFILAVHAVSWLQKLFPPDVFSPSVSGDRFVYEASLGAGVSACVYQAWDQASDRRVAIKEICKKQALSPLHEYLIARQVDHPCIIKTLDCIETPDQVYIVLEAADDGDLFDRVKPHSPQELSEYEARLWMLELACALDALHRHDFVHLDVKPENVLIHAGHVCLCDFGVACRRGSDPLLRGTGPYMAPELVRANAAAAAAAAAERLRSNRGSAWNGSDGLSEFVALAVATAAGAATTTASAAAVALAAAAATWGSRRGRGRRHERQAHACSGDVPTDKHCQGETRETRDSAGAAGVGAAGRIGIGGGATTHDTGGDHGHRPNPKGDVVALPAADAWAFGIVMYAVLFGDLPWETADAECDPDFRWFCQSGGVRDDVWPFSTLSPELCGLLGGLLQPVPQLRWSLAQAAGVLALNGPWFASAHGRGARSSLGSGVALGSPGHDELSRQGHTDSEKPSTGASAIACGGVRPSSSLPAVADPPRPRRRQRRALRAACSTPSLASDDSDASCRSWSDASSRAASPARLSASSSSSSSSSSSLLPSSL